jgi:transposase-like protein
MNGRLLEIGGTRFFSASEVAEVIRVSRQTLWRWRKQRKVPTGRLFRDGRIVFTTDEVETIREYANRLEPTDAASTPVAALDGSGDT